MHLSALLRIKWFMDLSKTITASFIDSFRDFGERVHKLAEGLSEEQFWTRPYPYGNSFGHLCLHIMGNLNHFIGAKLEHTGYVRNRELEFTDPVHHPKGEVLANLDQTITMVIESLEKQTEQTWNLPFEVAGLEDVKDRFSIYLRVAAHFHHHIGQMIYLVKEWQKA